MKIPAFRYPGGKAKIALSIVEYFPKIGFNYGEPFAGVGNLFWAVCGGTSYDRYHLNDLRNCRFFEAILRFTEEEIPFSIDKRLYEELKYQERDTDLALLLEPFISPFGCGYESGGFTTDFNSRTSYRRDKCVRNLELAKSFLGAKNPAITGRQWFDLNWWTEWKQGDFLYVDPPYYNTVSRTYPQIDHLRLLTTLKSCKCRWILSGYENTLYNNLLGSPFTRIKCNAEIGKSTGNSDVRIECLWRNQ